MIVSLNEIETLTLKACRGTGMSWGLAEETAQAARWLARYGLPWDRPLLSILSRRSEIAPPVAKGRTLRPARPGALLCPIHAGTAVADLLDFDDGWTLIDVLEPVWLLPLLHQRMQQWDAGVVLDLPDGQVGLEAHRPGEAGDVMAQVDHVPRVRLRLHRAVRSAAEGPEPGASQVAAGMASWNRLEALAALTYVPASLASRLAGAGAGVSDNDKHDHPASRLINNRDKAYPRPETILQFPDLTLKQDARRTHGRNCGNSLSALHKSIK